MTDSDTTSSASGTTQTDQRAASTPQRQETVRGGSDRGRTTIADTVVAKIATLAAREVDGVARLGGAASGAIGGVVGALRGNEHRTDGVNVEVGERQAAVDLTLSVRYPTPIHGVAESVRRAIMSRISQMTGLEVTEVNIFVADLAFPGGEESDDQNRELEQQSRVS